MQKLDVIALGLLELYSVCLMIKCTLLCRLALNFKWFGKSVNKKFGI